MPTGDATMGRVPNRLLSDARRTHRLTQQQLAEAVNAEHWRRFGKAAAIDAEHVSKLERGVITWPNSRYRAALREVLGADTDAELGFYYRRTAATVDTGEPSDDSKHDPILVAPWNHRGTVEAVVLLSGGVRVKRRVFLSLTGPALTAPAHQWLIHEPEPLVSGLSGQRISVRLVDRFSAMIAELRRMDDVAGGGNVLTLAQQQFGWVAGLLDQASYDDLTGRKLHTALAELGQFCGWATYDVGDFGLAQRYNIAALRAAHSADDRPLGAYVLGSMAKQVAREGSPAEAATLAETGLVGVRSHRTPRLLAQLHIRRAYASARLRDSSACAEAISKARAQIEQLDSGDDPPWLYWVVPAWITVEAGNCLLRLGQADRAAAMLRDGLALFDESFVRDQQLYTVRLADALTRPGEQHDLDAAAGLGMASIDLAESLDSILSADLLCDLCHRMTPHNTLPVVREFLERARGSLKGRNN